MFLYRSLLSRKLATLTWNIQDGKVHELTLKPYQRNDSIYGVPTLLDMLTYITWYPTLFSPPIPYVIYREWIHAPQKNCFTYYRLASKKLLLAAGCYFVSNVVITGSRHEGLRNVVLSQNSPFAMYTCLYILSIGFRFRRYYTWWIWESACIAAGIGIEDDDNSSYQRGSIQNFDIHYTELAQNGRQFWRYWNMRTQRWLRFTIYSRLPGETSWHKCLKLVLTFTFCGLWHGLRYHQIAWGFLGGVFQIWSWIVESRTKTFMTEFDPPPSLKRCSRLRQQRLNEFVQLTSPWSPYWRTSIYAATYAAQQANHEFDAVYEQGPPRTTESPWAIELSVPLERTRESSVITPAREKETDMRKNEVMDPTTFPSEVSSPDLEKKSQSKHIIEDAEIPLQSSSQPEENASISERKTPGDDLAPRAKTAFGAVELGVVAASLLLFASKFWQSTSPETEQLPQTFSSDKFTYLYYTLGWRHCVACRKTFLSPAAKRACVKWAKDMLAKYPEPKDWYHVRFSDEVHFAFGPQGRIYILRRHGERDCPDCIQEQEKKTRKIRTSNSNPDGGEELDLSYKLYAWAAIGYNFKSKLYFYDAGNSNGKMRHRTYRDQILEPIVKEWLEYGAADDFVLEEDGDSGHGYGSSSNPVSEWKKAHGLKSYKNCAGSPDFAPIENSWQVPKQWIKKHPHLDVDTLRELALEGWEHLRQDTINKWVEEMPQRLQDCIDSKGKMTGH
ncbi:MBOAT, membrane-bound O-acyltransferase family domain containing protein [Hyaloscypha variabilis]